MADRICRLGVAGSACLLFLVRFYILRCVESETCKGRKPQGSKVCLLYTRELVQYGLAFVLLSRDAVFPLLDAVACDVTLY